MGVLQSRGAMAVAPLHAAFVMGEPTATARPQVPDSSSSMGKGVGTLGTRGLWEHGARGAELQHRAPSPPSPSSSLCPGGTLRCSSMVRFCAKSSGQSGHLKTLTRWLSRCWSKWEESSGLWVNTVSHMAHL